MPDEKLRSLSIIYMLQGGRNSRPGEKKTAAVKHKAIILLGSDRSALKLIAAAAEPVKIMVVDMQTEWLKKEFSESSRFYENYFNALYKKVSTETLEYVTTVEESKLLQDIEALINMGTENALLLKAKIFLLISDFFSRFIRRPQQAIEEHRPEYYEPMMDLERILQAHLEKKLPELAVLAKQFSISPSTLKRHFKSIFKKNIYHYYLELKMNYAKKLFIEKGLSVNEVAALLQYENVSGFIEMFKKHHGISPGSLLKSEK